MVRCNGDREGSQQHRQGISATEHIPAVRPNAFNHPEPEQRSHDVDAAVSCVGAARSGGVHKRQEVSKQHQRGDTGDQPSWWFVEAPPSPEREATGDLRERRANVGKSSHPYLFRRQCKKRLACNPIALQKKRYFMVATSHSAICGKKYKRQHKALSMIMYGKDAIATVFILMSRATDCTASRLRPIGGESCASST